jgi:hypothetical protein
MGPCWAGPPLGPLLGPSLETWALVGPFPWALGPSLGPSKTRLSARVCLCLHGRGCPLDQRGCVRLGLHGCLLDRCGWLCLRGFHGCPLDKHGCHRCLRGCLCLTSAAALTAASLHHSESCNVRIEATVAAQRLGAAQRLDVLLLRRCLASSGQQPIISLWLPLGTDCNKMTDDASWGFHGPPWGCKRNSKNLLYRTNSI